MSLLENLNFFATILTFGCVSFAASNFGIKLGRLSGFKNNSGYQYISDSEKSEKLYEQIAKVAENEKGAPNWAKDKLKLKNWCKGHEKSLRHWAAASKYCLIKNNVRHKLIENGIDINEQCESANKSLLDSYADNNESLNFLLARKECTKTTQSR